MCAKFKWQEEKENGNPDWLVDGSSSTRGEKGVPEVKQATWWDRHGRKALFSLLWIMVGIVVIIALSSRFTNRVKGAGTVEPCDVEYIVAPVEGVVELLSAIEGQMVKKGELLAKIRPDNAGPYQNIETEVFDLAGLQKEPEKAKERIAMLSDNLGRLRQEADILRKDESEIQAAQEKILATEAEYKQAVKDEERARKLYQQEAISQVEYEDVVTRTEVARANSVISQKQKITLQNQRNIKEQQSLRDVESTEREITLEKETLKQRQSEYSQKRAMLQSARDQAGRLVVLASRDGQVIRRDKDVGEHVKNGDLVFTLAPDGRMVLIVKVSPGDSAKIQIGQKALIYPRSFSARFSGAGEGKVFQVGTYARLQGQQGQVTYVPVKVLIEKIRSPLVPGSFADVVIFMGNP
ncbi:MAG: HlyD family efflux transporter periplasmic adaptor subunit [Candidatus Omnitrophica bacterium]|nr:HlyD family efflux transporter periplasmic adaptor subunit [Candidatus Omnitrophota bacterium]